MNQDSSSNMLFKVIGNKIDDSNKEAVKHSEYDNSVIPTERQESLQ